MKIFNTMTGKKDEFIPLVPGKVSMYSCGPTVYNFFHIGNARPFIIFDTLRRYFEYLGYEVNFVQNFTDIDDKMINRANDEGITVKELAERFIAEYFKDAKGLNIKEATVHPRATDNIDEIIALVKTLEDKGYAYNVDGDVYFSTKKFKEYGKLSKQPLDDLEAGARINVNEQKRDPMDFAVWKKQKPGEPAWESPWGMGRPGWHIECSAMACRYLGETIDIHSGGKDLIFPHHENEIAQSECAHDKTFARYWMHNGYININNQKMSKSLNNFFTVREIAQEFDYEVIRFFMLSAHYRNPINFSKDLMEQSKASLERIKNCVSNLEFMAQKANIDSMSDAEKEYLKELEAFRTQFKDAMDDDLNTADAIAAIFDLVRSVNSFAKEGISKECAKNCIAMIKELCDVLGFLGESKEDDIDDEIKELIEKRQQARAEKNWAEADRIRDELKEKGIVLKDTPQGIKIERI